MPVRDVDKLVWSGTAVVRAESTGAVATAFRIAPRFVLTAAHVVGRDGLDSQVELNFYPESPAQEPYSCPGTVIALSPPPQPGQWFWPFPDLCVIEIDQEAVPSAVSMLVAEPVLSSAEGIKLQLLGMPGELSAAVPLTSETVEFDGYNPPFLKVGARTVRPGRSGAPVYSGGLGVVVGMMKASVDTSAPEGGLATPVWAGLRALGDSALYRKIVTAHDTYHRAHPRWRDLPRPDGDPEAWSDHLTLLGLLARLPDPPSGAVLTEMFQRICPAAPDRPEPSRLLHPRDLAELVFAEYDDPDALARLRVESAALGGASPELAQFAEFAHTTSEGRVTTDRLVSLVGVISEQPSAQQDGQAYLAELFTVWRHAQPHGQESDTGPALPEPGYRATCTSYPAARAELQALIDRYLADSDESVELIEIALPDDQLNAEKLHHWSRNPRNARDPRMLREFGRLQLRRAMTWQRTKEQRKILRDRWDKLSQSQDEDHGLLWLHCRDNPDSGSLHLSLHDRHGVGVTVPPGRDLLDHLAEFDACPVLLWNRCGCADHEAGAPACPGTRFRGALRDYFRTRPANDWFGDVERVQGAESGSGLESADDGADWAEIVYVLERPGHHRIHGYMAGPRSRGSEE